MKMMWSAALATLVLGAGAATAADFPRPGSPYGPVPKAPVAAQVPTCAQYCGQPPIVVQAPPPVPMAPAIVIAPPTAPLVYAAPGPVLFYPPPPRYYGPPPAPGPIYGGVTYAPPWTW
ncbi:hypothetical protein ACLBXM_06300 [Xanthobacteraceae bacterium A53D]